jgi:hypothetical protein
VGSVDEVRVIGIGRGFLSAEPERQAERDQEYEDGKSFHRGAEFMVLGWRVGEVEGFGGTGFSSEFVVRSS